MAWSVLVWSIQRWVVLVWYSLCSAVVGSAIGGWAFRGSAFLAYVGLLFESLASSGPGYAGLRLSGLVWPWLQRIGHAQLFLNGLISAGHFCAGLFWASML